MSRSTFTRRRARERARALTVGTSLTVRVPCSHGGDYGHQLTLETDTSGTLKCVRSTCSVSPPPPDEAAVLRALLGGDDEYHCCGEIPSTVRNAFVRLWTAHYDHVSKALSMIPPDVLESCPGVRAVLFAALNKAHEQRMRKHVSFSEAELAARLREDLWASRMKRHTDEITTPTGWSIHIVSKALSKNYSGPGIARVSIRWEGRYCDVARYLGGGRFSINGNGIRSLAQTVYTGQRSAGKDVCTVCGSRHRSIRTHAKSQRHLKNVEQAVYNFLEELGPRLARKHTKGAQE